MVWETAGICPIFTADPKKAQILDKGGPKMVRIFNFYEPEFLK